MWTWRYIPAGFMMVVLLLCYFIILGKEVKGTGKRSIKPYLMVTAIVTAIVVLIMVLAYGS